MSLFKPERDFWMLHKGLAQSTEHTPFNYCGHIAVGDVDDTSKTEYFRSTKHGCLLEWRLHLRFMQAYSL